MSPRLSRAPTRRMDSVKQIDEDEKALNYINQMGDDLSKIKFVYSVALPSKILMFKMMRASLGIKDVKKLWFYREKLTYNEF